MKTRALLLGSFLLSVTAVSSACSGGGSPEGDADSDEGGDGDGDTSSGGSANSGGTDGSGGAPEGSGGGSAAGGSGSGGDAGLPVIRSAGCDLSAPQTGARTISVNAEPTSSRYRAPTIRPSPTRSVSPFTVSAARIKTARTATAPGFRA